MTNLSKIKFMSLDDYDTSIDRDDVICAVDISELYGNSLFPDWSRKVDLASGTTYTVGSGALANYNVGYIWFGSTDWSHSYVYINGTTFDVGAWYTEDGHDRKLVFFPVSQGDTVRCDNGTSRYFLPIAGGI